MKDGWRQAAWHAANIMNMWVPRGKPAVTPERLLGADFFKDDVASPRMTREEWERDKEDLTKMARWHSKVVKEMKEGKRPKRTSIGFAELKADADGRLKPPPGSTDK